MGHHSGSIRPDMSKGDARIDSIVDLVTKAISGVSGQNTTIKETIDIQTKGASKTTKEINNIGNAAKEAVNNVEKLSGAYSGLLEKIQNSRGMNTDKFNKFANSLEQIKALINDVTSGMDRVSATGKGRTQIDYDINNIKKLAKPTIKQQQEWSKRVVSVVGNNQDISPDNLNVIKNTAMEMARLIEYFDRQSKLLKGIDIKHDTDFDIRAYADDSKELYRLQRMIMERNNTIKSITGTDILDGKELQKYIMGIIKADGSIINEKEFLSNLKKYIEDKLLRFDYKTLEDGTYNAKEVNARQRNFDRIIESRKSLTTTQKKINERRTPGAIPESELAKPERPKTARKQFQKYYGMSTSKALKGVMDAYREAASGELKDNKQLLAYFKAFKESGGNEKDIPKDIIEMITSLMEDQKTYGKYLEKLDAEFNEYRNSLPKEESPVETPATALPPVKEEIKETGAAAQEMGEQIKDGSKKGAEALDDLKGKAEETGKAIKEANDKAAEPGNTSKKSEEKTNPESAPMTRDQFKKHWKKDQEKEQKEPDDASSSTFKKAENIKELREQYKYLRMINESIAYWDEHGNALGAKMKDSKENLQKYKDEILSLNPQLESVSDNVDRIGNAEFVTMFADSFSSVDALEDAAFQIKTYQDRINNAGPNSPIDHWKAKLQQLQEVYVKIYDTLNKNGQLDADASSKKNISDLQEMYNSIRGITAEVKEEIETPPAGTSAPAQIAEETSQATDALTNFRKEYEETFNDTDLNINWGEDPVGTLDRIAARLKQIYEYRNEENFESRYGNEVVALLDIAKGAGFGDFITEDGVNHLNKNVQKYFNNVKRFVEARKLLDQAGGITSSKEKKEPTSTTTREDTPVEQGRETTAVINETAAAEEEAGKAAQNMASLSIEALKEMKDAATEAYDAVEKVLEISYLTSSGGRGRIKINLENWFEANSKTTDLNQDVNRLSSVINMAQNFDEVIQKLHDFMYARLRLLESDKMWLEPEKIPEDAKLVNKINKEQNRYYRASSQFNKKVYGSPEITREQIAESFKPNQPLPSGDAPASDGLEDLKKQLADLKAQAEETVAAIGLIYATPISADQDEDYYKNLYTEVENIGQTAIAMRGALANIQDPALFSEVNAINKQLDFIEQNVASQKGRIQSVYDSIDFNAREAEKLANQRVADITQRITGNTDFTQYGDQSWLQAYIDRARNETTELDQIYADFEKQLSERKAAILLQQQKDDALAENQDKFKSFIRGISPIGEDEYNLNMDKYRDVFNAITDEANTLDDAINKVKADLAQMEVDKFNSAKDGILSQYGKTAKDIPSDQWQAFLDGLANGSLTAADALKQLQDALEKMKNTTPPPQNNPPGDRNNNPPGGNIPPSVGQPGGGNGNNPPPNPPSPTPTPKKPPKKHKIISRSRKDDGSWEDRYSDELGNVWAEGERLNKKSGELEYYSQNITNYINLENEAIRVTKQLIDTQNALNKAKAEGEDQSVVDALRDRIKLLGQERKEVDRQAAEYVRRQTDPTSPYTMELYNERVGRKTKEYKTNADVKNAQMLVDLAEKEAAAKAKTDSILQKQRDKVDAITRKEIDTRNDIPDDTFNNLIDEYTSIVDMINSNKGQTSLSQAFQTQLDSAIKHFETSVAVMRKEAQIALKLSGKNPDEAKAVITKDMNALMEDMMRSTADGVAGQDGLQEQLQALMDSFAKSTDNSSGYIKSVNQQVNVLRSNFQQAENSMDFAKSVKKDVADYEKAVEQVGKIQAQMDFGDGKNNNQLVLQLEDAKNAAGDCFAQVERVQTAINQAGTGTDKWRQDINNRIKRANNKHTDEKTTASYLDAQAANDKKSLTDAQTALTKYEAALEKVAKAKANLVFGDESKRPALTEELTKAQEEASKLKAELDGVADVLKNSPLLSDQEKTANEKRLKADENIYNDPTKSPYYQSAQNVSGDKAKAEAVREIAKAYKEWYSAMNDVLKAAGNDEVLAEKRAIEAAKLRELMNTVDDAKTHGAISSSKDYQDEIDPLREAWKDTSYAAFDSYKQKLYTSYNDLIKQLGDNISPELKNEVDQIKQSLDQLFAVDSSGQYTNASNRKAIETAVNDINDLTKQLSKSNIKDLVSKNKVFNFGDAITKEFKSLEGVDVSREYKTALEEIQTAYQETQSTLSEKINLGTATSDDFQQAARAIDEYIKKLKDLQKTREANLISGKKGAYVQGLFGKLDAKDLGTSKQAIKDWVEANGGQIKGGMDAINASVGGKTFKFDRINDLDNSIQSVVLKLDSATGAVYEFVGEANKISLVSNVFKGLAGGIAQYATMMLSTHRVMSQFTSQFKQGFSMLTEYDKALTTISYTMDVSKEQLGQMGQAAVDMANDLKMSLSDTLDIYQIYANMNTSPEEIRETAMPTAILANLSGVDASTAADQIQGVIQQFRLLEDAEASAADVSMHIADVFDKISANISMDYARGIKTMADAVQKTGAEAMNAGLSFEQLSAITAKVAERTRAEGSEIGGAIRTNNCLYVQKCA